MLHINVWIYDFTERISRSVTPRVWRQPWSSSSLQSFSHKLPWCMLVSFVKKWLDTDRVSFLSLDIADVSDQRIGILFFLYFRQCQLKLKVWLTSRLHWFYTLCLSLWLDLWWTILALLCRQFLLGTEQTVASSWSTNWSTFHHLTRARLVLALQYTSIPVDPKQKGLDTARDNLLDIVRINFF